MFPTPRNTQKTKREKGLAYERRKYRKCAQLTVDNYANSIADPECIEILGKNYGRIMTYRRFSRVH